MVEEKTDYVVLGVVGAVAVVAILSMFSLSYSGSAPGRFDGATLTGYAAAQADVSPERPMQHLIIGSSFDFNTDGVVDSRDSPYLAHFITTGSCPTGMQCDVNSDGALSLEDLHVFNRQIPRAPPVDVPPVQRARVRDVDSIGYLLV